MQRPQADDWKSPIWGLWQDTYLLALEELGPQVDNDSVAGEGWLRDLGWLEDLGLVGSYRHRGIGAAGVITSILYLVTRMSSTIQPK